MDIQQMNLNHSLPEDLQCPIVARFFVSLRLGSSSSIDVKEAKSGNKIPIFRILRHPLVVISVAIFTMVRSLAIIFWFPSKLSQEDLLHLHLFGDMSVAVGLRYHLNALILIFGNTLLLYHWTHYRGTRSNVSKLRLAITSQNIAPFRLLLGKCSPNEIGLRSQFYTKLLLHQAHLYCRLVPLMQRIALLVGFGTPLIQLIRRSLEKDFGTPLAWSLLPVYSVCYAIFYEYFYTATIYHIFYLTIMCKYLRVKLEQLQEDLKLRLARYPGKLMQQTSRITQDMHRIMWEVASFNRYFWSRIILLFVACFVLAAGIIHYCAMYGKLLLSIRVLGMVANLLGSVAFAMLLHTVSRINRLGKAIHRQMHEYHGENYAMAPCRKFANIREFRTKFQFQNIVLNQFKPKKFTFTCGSFFSINYRIFLEIIFICAMVFMKILQFISNSTFLNYK